MTFLIFIPIEILPCETKKKQQKTTQTAFNNEKIVQVQSISIDTGIILKLKPRIQELKHNIIAYSGTVSKKPVVV